MVLCAFSVVYYLGSCLRDAALVVRAGIDAQTAAIERHTSFVQRECDRERMSKIRTPQRANEYAMALEQELAGAAGATEHGFRNTQRRI